MSKTEAIFEMIKNSNGDSKYLFLVYRILMMQNFETKAREMGYNGVMKRYKYDLFSSALENKETRVLPDAHKKISITQNQDLRGDDGVLNHDVFMVSPESLWRYSIKSLSKFCIIRIR